MPSEPVIDYYFAPMSGYAYLGHRRFLEIAGAVGAKVNYHPLDMARIFAAAGSFPPAKYPAVRQQHRKADLARWAVSLGLPINATPAYWPAPMALACRVIAAAQGSEDQVTEAVLSAVWVHDLNIASEGDLAQTLDRHGIDAAPILARANTPEVADIAALITKQAIDAGVFGSPIYAFDGQWYFGQDRLHFLRAHLQGEAEGRA